MCSICGKKHNMKDVTETDLRSFIMEKDAQHFNMCLQHFEEGFAYAYVLHWKVNGDKNNMFYVYRNDAGDLIGWYCATYGGGYKADSATDVVVTAS